MNRVVFVYARSDSRRLPGKALLPLYGPLLVDVVLSRAQRVGAEKCALLTTDRTVDDTLAARGSQNGVQVVRGDPFDLIARSLQAIEETRATHFLRVNCDSPLFAPELARAAMTHLDNCDFVSNLYSRRFPYGVAVEWVRSSTYQSHAGNARPPEREHVTQHLYQPVGQLKVLSMVQDRDDSNYRLAIDSPQDYLLFTSRLRGRDPIALTYWQLLDLEPPQCIFL